MAKNRLGIMFAEDFPEDDSDDMSIRRKLRAGLRYFFGVGRGRSGFVRIGTQVLFRCGYDNFGKYFLGIICRIDECEEGLRYWVANIDDDGDSRIYYLDRNQFYHIT